MCLNICFSRHGYACWWSVNAVHLNQQLLAVVYLFTLVLLKFLSFFFSKCNCIMLLWSLWHNVNRLYTYCNLQYLGVIYWWSQEFKKPFIYGADQKAKKYRDVFVISPKRHIKHFMKPLIFHHFETSHTLPVPNESKQHIRFQGLLWRFFVCFFLTYFFYFFIYFNFGQLWDY